MAPKRKRIAATERLRRQRDRNDFLASTCDANQVSPSVKTYYEATAKAARAKASGCTKKIRKTCTEMGKPPPARPKMTSLPEEVHHHLQALASQTYGRYSKNSPSRPKPSAALPIPSTAMPTPSCLPIPSTAVPIPVPIQSVARPIPPPPWLKPSTHRPIPPPPWLKPSTHPLWYA